MSGRLRRAGARWRLLAHVPGGRSHDVASSRRMIGPVDRTATILPGTVLDEVVIQEWLHLEQLDVGVWTLRVAGVRLEVRADRDGKPTHLFSQGVEHPHKGCTYDLTGDWG